MYAAANRLERHGIALAANEVQFSIFHRGPERNGVLEACRELDVALIAYRPLSGGRNREDGSALDRAIADIARGRRRPSPRSGSTGCCPETNESSPFPEPRRPSTCSRTWELPVGR